MRFVAAVIFASFFPAFSVVFAGEAAAKQAVSADGTVSMTIPGDWEQADVRPTVLLVASPLESDSDLFQENVSVIRHPASAAPSLERFAAAWKSMAGDSGATILEEGAATIGSVAAMRIKYSIPVEGVDVSQVCAVYLVAPKGAGYEITASTIEPDADRWLPAMEHYVGTIRFSSGG